MIRVLRLPSMASWFTGTAGGSKVNLNHGWKKILLSVACSLLIPTPPTHTGLANGMVQSTIRTSSVIRPVMSSNVRMSGRTCSRPMVGFAIWSRWWINRWPPALLRFYPKSRWPTSSQATSRASVNFGPSGMARPGSHNIPLLRRGF